MRRADRLFSIIQLLRRKRVVTAAELAAELEVSERTIYRDLRDLAATGTPVEGEPGVGYRLRGYDLPPLMFDPEEIEALVLGARVVESFADKRLARAARSALSKVRAALPRRLEPLLEKTTLFAPLAADATVSDNLSSLRHAMAARRKVRAHYRREDGAESERLLWPLGAFFWGRSWTVAAWCELREGFRNFRVDRFSRIDVTEEAFPDEPGKTLRDYLAGIDERALELLRI